MGVLYFCIFLLHIYFHFSNLNEIKFKNSKRMKRNKFLQVVGMSGFLVGLIGLGFCPNFKGFRSSQS